ncbi:hypothetical protein PAPYR_5336 [Paratrimastix pyriformis]|uniref:Eukaryotic translation initiation factor 3 30 kDa subunit n=1 Tax=Paratrimastix pyriformis TaxID=342808 RepID=A0ABQ8UHV4_9EUKA|nr:hypothetical protein PAPYR_5336 [Paratrimastix pyriformis]
MDDWETEEHVAIGEEKPEEKPVSVPAPVHVEVETRPSATALPTAIDPLAADPVPEALDEETLMMNPTTPSQYTKFAHLLIAKFMPMKKNENFKPMLFEVLRGLSNDLQMSVEDLKEIGGVVTAITNQRLQDQKSGRNKKKASGATSSKKHFDDRDIGDYF